MINDNFNFKKILKESIREREGSIESLGEGESFKPPEKSNDEKNRGTIFRPPEADGLDKNVKGFKLVPYIQPDGKPNEFYDMAIELWDKLKGDEATVARVIPKFEEQVKVYLQTAAEAGRDQDDKRRKGKEPEEDRGETAREAPEVSAALEAIIGTDFAAWEKARNSTASDKLKISMDYIEDVATQSISEQRYLKLFRKFRINGNNK
jgi:hypothetical protein